MLLRLKPDELQRWGDFYGINYKNTRPIKPLLGLIFCVYLLVQSIMVLILKSHDKKDLLNNFADVLFNECCLWLFYEAAFLPKYARKSLEIITNRHYDYKSQTTDRKLRFIEQEDQIIIRMLTVFRNTQLTYHTTIYFTPFLVGTWSFLTKGKHEIRRYEKFFPSEQLLPFELDSYLVYLVVYSCNLVFYYVRFEIVILLWGSTVAVIRYLISEFKLLNVSVRELYEVCNDMKHDQDGSVQQWNLQWNFKELNVYIGRLVEHHNSIYRYLKTINDNLALTTLNINKSAIVFCCLNFYCFFEMDSLTEKMKYAVSIILVMAIVLFYARNGQALEDAGEELRMALLECPWLDFPVKYRKALLLMMLQTSREMQIKPLGLYSWNLKYYSSTLHAAYAYCNFLRTTLN